MLGSRPKTTDISKEFKEIKELLLPTADILKDDYDHGMFNNFLHLVIKILLKP